MCEKQSKLGGQWLVASYGAEKGDYRTLIPYKEDSLKETGVKVLLNQEVDKDYLQVFDHRCGCFSDRCCSKELTI